MSPHSISVPLILPSLAFSRCLCERVSVIIKLRCPCGREADWFSLQQDLLLLQSYMNSVVASPPSPKHYSYLWWDHLSSLFHCHRKCFMKSTCVMDFYITDRSQKGNLRFINLHFTCSQLSYNLMHLQSVPLPSCFDFFPGQFAISNVVGTSTGMKVLMKWLYAWNFLLYVHVFPV